jgi:uncharacterized protein YggE
MRSALVVLLAAGMSFASFKTYQENVMNVEGNAVVKVVPDLAVLKIGASFKSTSLDTALRRCDRSLRNLRETMAKFGVAEADVKTNNVAISPEFEWEKGEKVLRGQKVKKTFKIFFRDLSKLQGFLFEAVKGGANEIDDFEFTHSKLDSLQKNIIDLAVKDAYYVADKLARNTGTSVGKPLVISNVEPENFSYENKVDFERMLGSSDLIGCLMGGDEGASELQELFALSPGLIEIRNKVYITFELVRK